MLDHQIEFAKSIEEVYKPISGRASDLNSYVDDVGNPEGIRACEEYQVIVQELKASLQPELEMIKTRIVGPADELIGIVKNVRKMVVKRDHKQIDYDREKNKLKKLQDKTEKTAKDESAIWNTENKLEEVTEAYNDLNNLLKRDLDDLFKLERAFILPLFQSFYYMQLNVFYTLHERMQDMDIGYFNLTLDIEDAFQEKRGDVQAQVEGIPIVKFRTTGQRRPLSKYQAKLGYGSKPGIENGHASSKSSLTSPTSPKQITHGDAESPPPPYEANGALGRSASTGASWGAAAKGKVAPPPPKPKPGRLSGAPVAETVTALYDYEAQAEGDLSFSAGDTIEVVTRTDNANEWWVGRIGVRQGQFPGEMKSFLSCVRTDD